MQGGARKKPTPTQLQLGGVLAVTQLLKQDLVSVLPELAAQTAWCSRQLPASGCWEALAPPGHGLPAV